MCASCSNRNKSLLCKNKEFFESQVFLKMLCRRLRHMTDESKCKIYKAIVRPVLTYGAETRADTQRTKRLLNTAEMSILIVGKTRLDRVRKEDVTSVA